MLEPVHPHVLEAAAKRRLGVVAVHEAGGGRGLGLLVERDHQLFLRLEVDVQRARGQARLARDGRHGEAAQAGLLDQREGGLGDGAELFVVLGFTAAIWYFMGVW